MKTAPKTQKKFVRNPSAYKTIQLQARDLAILQSVVDYRFLDTEHIKALHPSGRWGILKRLQLLYHHGYLDRPPQQISYFKPRNHLIYALGDRGADLIFRDRPDLRGRVNWQQKNNQAQFPYIWHAMMISDFRVALTLALQAHPTAKLKSWRQGRDLVDHVILENSKTKQKEKVPVAPDAYFVIDSGRDLLHFFLEADRSTMTNQRFLNKLRAYWRWWKEKKQVKKFGLESKIGVRVLSATISEERKENLRAAAKEADDHQKGSPMFLFACEKKYRFSQPETILNPFWQSPANDSFHHLLE